MNRHEALAKIKELEQFIEQIDEAAPDILDRVNFKPHGCIHKSSILKQDNFLFIPLPAANTEWSLEAFDVASQIIQLTDGRAYIAHDQDHERLDRNICIIFHNEL